jgi:hypothetical protein
MMKLNDMQVMTQHDKILHQPYTLRLVILNLYHTCHAPEKVRQVQLGSLAVHDDVLAPVVARVRGVGEILGANAIVTIFADFHSFSE